MKKVFVVACTVFLALTCFVSGMVTPVQANPDYTLTLNLPIPPIHTRWTNALEIWVKELQNRSAGRIEVETFFAEALSPRSEAYESVQSGIADLTESAFEANTGQFLFHENILSIPTPSRNMTAPMGLINSLYEQLPQALDEINGAKLLFCHAGLPQVIGTKDRPIRTLEDLRGLKINANSAMIAERLKALGVSVVSMPMSDIYTALEQGVIDGTTLEFELLVSRRFGDQIKYMTALSVQNTLFYVAMNEDVYNSLPADLKQIIDEVSGEYAASLFKNYWDAAGARALEIWLTEMKGQEVIVLSDSDYAKAAELMQPPVDAWFNQLTARGGLPGNEVKEAYYRLEDANSEAWKDSDFYRHYLNIKQ